VKSTFVTDAPLLLDDRLEGPHEPVLGLARLQLHPRFYLPHKSSERRRKGAEEYARHLRGQGQFSKDGNALGSVPRG
jgi:hypothetical protein